MSDFLNEIIGQTKAKKILAQFINSSKIPHALLFTGIEGVGKEYAAIKFAQAINFDSKNESKKSDSLLNLILNILFRFHVEKTRQKEVVLQKS